MTARPRGTPTAAPTIVGVELAVVAATAVVVAEGEDVDALIGIYVVEDPDVVLADTNVAAEAAAEVMSELSGFANIVPNPGTEVDIPEQQFPSYA
ncbi:hypothetical protein BPAE_0087g00420 [Botrytis paeoniae]|uniref:Uncharacterized protein n=1 Tax=Botrytis paeoniae TaxID=278948 RepID=A0A4Z1FK21_9HELO|nr:hypothetical protein BPAE_0087g00420 [Botrytis paeoniae]